MLLVARQTNPSDSQIGIECGRVVHLTTDVEARHGPVEALVYRVRDTGPNGFQPIFDTDKTNWGYFL